MQWQETGKGAEAGRRQRQRQEAGRGQRQEGGRGRKEVEAGRRQRQEAGRGQRQEGGQKQEEDRGRGISEIEFSLVHRESSRRARPTY